MNSSSAYLDPYSTSQTDLGFLEIVEGYTHGKKKADTPPKCQYHAPYFAIQTNSGSWVVKVGCCNHWDCARCGVTRAKEEYWRIVQGGQKIVSEGHTLWFVTITTRGSGLKVGEAEKGYLEWTNKLLTNLRGQTNRGLGKGDVPYKDCPEGVDYWCYVQVTERQRRKHPHSHILTTYRPVDIFDSDGEIIIGVKQQWEQVNGEKIPYWKDAVRSNDLQSAVCSCGLGEQYDISPVRDISAVARYIGKYLFKSSLLTKWPPNWRRVRYSHNWPKSEVLPKSQAFPIIKKQDWYKLATLTDVVTCFDGETAQAVAHYMWAYGTKVRQKQAS